MIPLSQIVRTFGRIGLLSFGGPAAQIALMHRVLVDEHRWLTEQQFLRALSLCMLLPGPEAMQLATYAGWRLRGTAGGLIAGALFVLPGAYVIAILALLYAQYGTAPQADGLLLGIKATVIVIVVQALLRLRQKALQTRADMAIAVLSFTALYLVQTPFPLVIALAALWGATFGVSDPADDPRHADVPVRYWRKAATSVVAWLVLWLAPLPILWATGHRLLFDLAAFFAKLAVVSFGGAYAVLAYMAQEVVQTRNWMSAEQMVDALGLAETTPGPLILVTQFVGQLTGHQAGGIGLALVASVLTLWMTFVPCFLWIFTFAPHLERLLSRPRLQSALRAITAAVLGVIANLSLWFALHVLFGTVQSPKGWLSPALPDPGSFRPEALALTILAATLLLGFKRSIPLTLAVTAATGLALT